MSLLVSACMLKRLRTNTHRQQKVGGKSNENTSKQRESVFSVALYFFFPNKQDIFFTSVDIISRKKYDTIQKIQVIEPFFQTL